MTKEKQTTTKTVEPVVTKTIETPIAKKTNTHGIGNLNQGYKKNPRAATTYKLNKVRRDKKGHIKYPVVSMLKAEDVIYDPEKSVNRKIRYILGEPSIFEDEQKKDSKVKSPITFSNGFLRVDYTNPTLKKFLDMCNANASNINRVSQSPPLFKIMDYEKEAKEKMKKEVKSMDALRTVFEMPLNKLLGYAQVLGINVDKSTDEIRYDMKVLAEKDPVNFISGLDDPKMEIKQTILRGRDANILDWDSQKITWVQGSQRPVITHVPLGVKPIDCLADMCMTDKGSGIIDQIKVKMRSMN
tara:strand:- start:11721 stop:12617 length:897 start_codon:yes stop_codon:yes gene_type:complete